ncbi:MAG: hypothetical protein FJ086_12605 [Deltaproteobacteria bacterium]|nr:hypothetical protein [Deltaproteobacteria bacterium]
MATGQCAPSAGRADCADCTLDPSACGFTAQCLGFIAEGQDDARFCGEACTSHADCPAGFNCTGVIYSCNAEGESCPADPAAPAGESFTCKGFLVENEQGTQFYCSDSTGTPHEYYRACAPSSGFCPATVAP